MKTSNIILIIIVGIIAVGIISSLSLANNRMDRKLNTVDSVFDSISQNDFKEGFVEGCMEEGADRDYCVCAFDYMDSRTTNSEMLDIALEIEAGNMPDILFDMLAACIEYLDL